MSGLCQSGWGIGTALNQLLLRSTDVEALVQLTVLIPKTTRALEAFLASPGKAIIDS